MMGSRVVWWQTEELDGELHRSLIGDKRCLHLEIAVTVLADFISCQLK